MTTAVDNVIREQYFQIRPFDAPAGAEIVGLEIAETINAADFARISTITYWCFSTSRSDPLRRLNSSDVSGR